MASNEMFLNQRQRYQPVTLPQDFSDEEMARVWTLSEADQQEIGKYRKNSRLFIATQLCAVRLYGRFVMDVNDLSPRIINYLNGQLALPASGATHGLFSGSHSVVLFRVATGSGGVARCAGSGQPVF